MLEVVLKSVPLRSDWAQATGLWATEALSKLIAIPTFLDLQRMLIESSWNDMLRGLCVCMCIYIYIYIYIYMYVYMYMYMHMYMYMYMYMYMLYVICICICMCIYIYIYICIDTYEAVESSPGKKRRSIRVWSTASTVWRDCRRHVTCGCLPT